MYGVTMWWWRTSSHQGSSNFHLHDWAEASHTENCEVCALENTAAYIVPSSAVLLQIRVGTEFCHCQPTGPVLVLLVRAGPSWNKNFRTTASFLLLMNQLFHSLELIRPASNVWWCSELRVKVHIGSEKVSTLCCSVSRLSRFVLRMRAILLLCQSVGHLSEVLK